VQAFGACGGGVGRGRGESAARGRSASWASVKPSEVRRRSPADRSGGVLTRESATACRFGNDQSLTKFTQPIGRSALLRERLSP
jgi:hypothetical protein